MNLDIFHGYVMGGFQKTCELTWVTSIALGAFTTSGVTSYF